MFLKLHAQTSTSWTLCIALTVNPTNHAAPAACVLGDLHKKNAWLLLHKKPCIPFSSQTAECIFVAKQMRSAFRCSHSPHLYDIKPSSIGIGLNLLDFLVILIETQFLVLDAHLRASGN